MDDLDSGKVAAQIQVTGELLGPIVEHDIVTPIEARGDRPILRESKREFAGQLEAFGDQLQVRQTQVIAA